MSLGSKFTLAGWLLALAWLPLLSALIVGENFGWFDMIRRYFIQPIVG